MANQQNEDLFDLLRARGLRKKVARSIAALDGNSRRSGVKGERLARQAVEDLTAAAEEIRKRVLRTDRGRSKAARKAARTRHHKATKRTASAKKGVQTRASVARARAKGGRAAGM
jgi:hypothetical protein